MFAAAMAAAPQSQLPNVGSHRGYGFQPLQAMPGPLVSPNDITMGGNVARHFQMGTPPLPSGDLGPGVR